MKQRGIYFLEMQRGDLCQDSNLYQLFLQMLSKILDLGRDNLCYDGICMLERKYQSAMKRSS